MEGFDPATSFGPDIAGSYDDDPRGDEEETVEFLATAAAAGSALEFAIGTGRIGLPLAARGIQVHGIELSPDMIERLRAKQGGELIPVVRGDMSTAATGTRYGLVYLIFNTIFNLLTEDAQIRCFENAARHLTGDGVLVVEAAVPRFWLPTRDHQYVNAEHIGVDRVVLDVCRYDPVSQLLEENHVRLSAEGITMMPIVCRLISPGEMDLMARIAGLRLADRWAGWRREPFAADSPRHVSVYTGR